MTLFLREVVELKSLHPTLRYRTLNAITFFGLPCISLQ